MITNPGPPSPDVTAVVTTELMAPAPPPPEPGAPEPAEPAAPPAVELDPPPPAPPVNNKLFLTITPAVPLPAGVAPDATAPADIAG